MKSWTLAGITKTDLRSAVSLFPRLRGMALAAALLAIVPAASFAQDGAAQTTASRTSLGDMMIIIQLRHAKVWYAARLGNWPLAAYEVRQLSATLERAAELNPDLPSSFDAAAEAMMEATSSEDGAAFDTAFRELTASCNACHQAADVGFIEIRVPTRPSPYSNQVFGSP